MMELFDVYPLFDVEPVRGEGSYIYDRQGNEYLDFYGGHAVISIGHSHPHYIQRINDQLGKLGFYSNSIQNPLQVKLAHKLGVVSGLDDFQLFLCNSGAEANENALKLAAFHNQRTRFVALQKGFHGRTSAAVNVTDNSKIQATINHCLEVERYHLDDIESICSAIEIGDKCGVILEAIQGIGGVQVITNEGLERIAESCKKTNTVLIMDEVQCGYARSGKFFAYQYTDIEPDIITVAKGMGNGFPIGGTLIHPRFKPKYGMLGSTFGGNHLACAAGLAVLEIIESENLMVHAQKMGDTLQNKIMDLNYPIKLTGRGLMIGLEFDFPISILRKKLITEQHIFTGSSSNPHILRLLPPLNIPEHEIDRFVEGLDDTLKQIT